MNLRLRDRGWILQKDRARARKLMDCACRNGNEISDSICFFPWCCHHKLCTPHSHKNFLPSVRGTREKCWHGSSHSVCVRVWLRRRKFLNLNNSPIRSQPIQKRATEKSNIQHTILQYKIFIPESTPFHSVAPSNKKCMPLMQISRNMGQHCNFLSFSGVKIWVDSTTARSTASVQKRPVRLFRNRLWQIPMLSLIVRIPSTC